jgi:predicted small lipoprotein YifL
MTQALRLCAFGALLAVVLAGCGVRGSLERPGGDAAATPAAKDGQSKDAPAEPKKHRPFILDGLL